MGQIWDPPSQKCSETDLKKSQTCPIWDQSDPNWMPNWHPWFQRWDKLESDTYRHFFRYDSSTLFTCVHIPDSWDSPVLVPAQRCSTWHCPWEDPQSWSTSRTCLSLSSVPSGNLVKFRNVTHLWKYFRLVWGWNHSLGVSIISMWPPSSAVVHFPKHPKIFISKGYYNQSSSSYYTIICESSIQVFVF